MANLFQFCGKLRAVKDGYSEQEFSGGLIKKRIRAQMICGDSTQFIEASALVWKDEKKNVIRTFKHVENGNDEKLEVKWADRFNEDIVNSVAGYRRFVIDTDTYATRKALEEAGFLMVLEAETTTDRYYIIAEDENKEYEE